MKKLLFILGSVGVIASLLIPSIISARCEMPCCCIEYCEDLTFDYKVSYFERVEVGMFQGRPCYAGVWTTVIVEDVYDEYEAAESLGLRAGYDCWVSKVF